MTRKQPNDEYDETGIWMYEWDTDYHDGMDSYDDTKETAREFNVGYFVTEDESTIFVGLKDDLEKFLAHEKVYDREEITQFHYIDTSRSDN